VVLNSWKVGEWIRAEIMRDDRVIRRWKIINLDGAVNANLKVMAHTLNHNAITNVIDIFAKKFS
jgi:hypothetical protein